VQFISLRSPAPLAQPSRGVLCAHHASSDKVAPLRRCAVAPSRHARLQTGSTNLFCAAPRPPLEFDR
jgi:hypothetical protein